MIAETLDSDDESPSAVGHLSSLGPSHSIETLRYAQNCSRSTALRAQPLQLPHTGRILKTRCTPSIAQSAADTTTIPPSRAEHARTPSFQLSTDKVLPNADVEMWRC
jgi:hypothetical protein